MDLYKHFSITPKVDIWALGCVMFTLMYHKPPFAEGEKLAQINGNYQLPPSPSYTPFCTSLLKAMLTVDPQARLSAEQVFYSA